MNIQFENYLQISMRMRHSNRPLEVLIPEIQWAAFQREMKAILCFTSLVIRSGPSLDQSILHASYHITWFFRYPFLLVP